MTRDGVARYHAAMRPAFRLPAVLLVALGALAGCKSDQPRIVIGPETLVQIEPGTSRKFVVALLGEPTDKFLLDDGLELWKWGYREKKTSSGSVVYVIESTPRAQTEHGAYVQFRDGLVTKAWND